jgi:hypothetical protein
MVLHKPLQVLFTGRRDCPAINPENTFAFP